MGIYLLIFVIIVGALVLCLEHDGHWLEQGEHKRRKKDSWWED
jgi:hypothetical protein